MYTVEDNNKNEDNYEEYEPKEESFWDLNKGIIIKVIIIILCIIALIWLILALKNNDNDVYDEKTHDINVLKVRLAAEKYFFINNNMPVGDTTKTVDLQTLKSNGLVDDVIDYNKRVCDGVHSNVSLKPEVSAYVLRINLSCSTKEKEEVFYYDRNNKNKCLNCNGETNMDGKDIAPSDKEDVVPIDYDDYSCKTWSEWSSKRVTDPMLQERSRTLVKGVKIGGTKEVITYGEWTDYTETPIEATNNLEVEVITKNEQRWSDNLVSTTPVTASETLKVISVDTVPGNSYTTCPSGYKKEGKICISESTKTGNLSYSQYNSYRVHNRPCNDTIVQKNSNGKYETVYVGCEYSTTTGLITRGSSGYTTYTYQILEEKTITYYRSRTKTTKTVQEENVYTDNYYEEANLPQGFVKVEGSEKIEYSYKYSTCEK